MKNKMRKLVSLSLAVSVAMTMAACGVGGSAQSVEPAAAETAEAADAAETVDPSETDAPAQQEEGNEEAAKDHYIVGICQLVQHVALDAATQGFKDAIVEKLGEDAVTFDEQNAAGDSAQCTTI